MAKDKALPSKGALKLQTACFVALVLMAILPLGFMFYLGLIASASYLSFSPYENYLLNIGLCASAIFLFAITILYAIGKTLRTRWQEHMKLETEAERIHKLLEKQ